MKLSEAFGALRYSRGVKIIGMVAIGLVLIAIGALWSPQERSVERVQDCVRAAHQLGVDPVKCMPLVEKMSK